MIDELAQNDGYKGALNAFYYGRVAFMRSVIWNDRTLPWREDGGVKKDE